MTAPLTIVTTFWGRLDLARAMIEHTANLDANRIGVVSPDDPHAAALLDALAEDGWHVVTAPNEPLGAKWNAGVEAARKFGVPVMVLGSDDFAAAWWCRRAATLAASFDVVGLSSFLAHRRLTGETIHVVPYPEGDPRHGESVGSGRTLSTRLLDVMQWRPWPAAARRSLDGYMMSKASDLLPDARVFLSDAEGMLVDVRCEGDGISSWWQYALGAPEAALPEWMPDVEPPDSDAPPAKASAAIIALVRDEAEFSNLSRAIASIADVVSEIVIVLDDRSIAGHWDLLAERVEVRPFTGFADQRNYAASLCSHDWVVVIDADERIVLPGDLRERIADCPDDRSVVNVSAYSVTDRGVEESFVTGRAYRRSRCHWRYHPHNELVMTETGRAPGLGDVVMSTAVLESLYIGATQAKASRALPGLLAAQEADPSEPRWPFFLARTYAGLGDLPNALKAALRCVELAPTDKRYARAYYEGARYALDLGRTQDLNRLLGEGLNVHSAHPDLNYLALVLQLQRWGNALHSREYSAQPCASMKYAGALQTIAGMLGLGLRFDPREGAK